MRGRRERMAGAWRLEMWREIDLGSLPDAYSCVELPRCNSWRQ